MVKPFLLSHIQVCKTEGLDTWQKEAEEFLKEYQ